MQTIDSNNKEMLLQEKPYLSVREVSKVYPTLNGNSYTVLDNIDLTIKEGEFICLIGHSGCGKSTLLNIIAGFSQPSTGQVKLKDALVSKPGPDRMMVFQNYSLLPWKTAYENVYLAVNRVYQDRPDAEKHDIVAKHLAMVGLTEAAQKKPHQLSGGMKQRVAIARALAIRPKVLILDEPFGALDAITKEELQEELIKIWQEHNLTILMITHDIDEALFLADRVIMMTNGPAAKIGEIMDIPFDRPRIRDKIMDEDRYHELRNEALDFLYNRFAHSEDPVDDQEELDLKAVAKKVIAGIAIAAFAGFAIFGAITMNKTNNPNGGSGATSQGS
jgi:nitrate/nitrite transport system ATP-binding protein